MFFSRQLLLGLGFLALSVSAAPRERKKRGCKTHTSTGTSTLPPSTSNPTPTPTDAPTSAPAPAPTSAPPSSGAGCFPFGNATLSDDTPTQYKRADWWCPKEQQYGFMGFTYPLEDKDCNSYMNSFDKFNKDFKTMKSMGASLVRIYAPECRGKSVWENLLKAGVENNMGVIGLVWWGYDQSQDNWKKTRDSLLAVLAENPLAPYVFHSMAFGSEPILDHVQPDDEFMGNMQAFKDQLQPYGIPIAVSDAWDLGELTQGGKLTDLGKRIRDTSDLVHGHMMPYYHCDKYPTANNVMDFFKRYIEQLIVPNMNGMPILITETQWASFDSKDVWHRRDPKCRGSQDIENFKTFWNTYSDNCQYWKQHNVGWFAHVFSDEYEDGFGMLDQNGNPKMDFHPQKC